MRTQPYGSWTSLDEGTMTASDSPTVARRRVRLALREAREAVGRTQSDVAEAMEWSLSKVIRIESGEVSISPNDLRPLLTYLGINDRRQIDELTRDAKLSRARARKSWWQESPFREHLTPATRRLIEFEQEAVAARYFSTYTIPGPLQHHSFAEAVLRQWNFGLSDEDVALRLEARMRRRRALLTRNPAPRLSVLLDESLVRRPFGGINVLIETLKDLLKLIKDGRIVLRIVPFSIDAPLPNYGTYDLLYLSADGDDDDAVIYREFELLDEIVEDKVRAAQHRLRFDELWNASLDEQATVELVQQRLSELGAEDRSTPST
jgi:transcriptional regulator with XRE-family HTH domain